MLFQFLFTKFSNYELFSCLKKVDHVTNYCKKKKAYTNYSDLRSHIIAKRGNGGEEIAYR